MPRLPIVSGRDLIKALERLGFVQVRQRGSHAIMRKGDAGCVVPLHREVAPGTLSSAIKQAGLTLDTVLDALK